MPTPLLLEPQCTTSALNIYGVMYSGVSCLYVYHRLFYYFEERGKLDPLSERDLYCLHLVYLNKINTALKAFQDGWNNHAITTEHSK